MTDRPPALSADPDSGTPAGAIVVRLLLGLGLLYLFLVGIGLLQAGIKVLGAGFQEGVLSNFGNPVAALFAGILATVLVQSSSVTTSTIVGMVGSGALSVEAAAPMIMGANIGTTITNTLVSLGHARRAEEFRRAFAAATMHDFFNITTVVLFFPLEVATGFLTHAAQALADVVARTGITGGETTSPLKRMVKAPVNSVESLLDRFSDSTEVLGTLLIVVGIVVLFAALLVMSRNMRALIAERMERAVNSIVARGGGAIGVAVGAVITLVVQSSSVTTSIVVPLVGSGVLGLRNGYPLTLGANLGTPITALLASLAVDQRAGLVIALHHALFNIGGVLLYFLLRPVPGDLRHIPVRLAEMLAGLAVRNRVVVAIYVVGVFMVVPLAGILVLR